MTYNGEAILKIHFISATLHSQAHISKSGPRSLANPKGGYDYYPLLATFISYSIEEQFRL